MAAFSFASIGAGKAAYGLAAYTIFVLLEGPLGTAGCLAAEAVVMGVVLWHRQKSTGKEATEFPPDEIVAEEPEKSGKAAGSPSDGAKRSGNAKGGRRNAASPAQPAQQPGGGQPADAASASKGAASNSQAAALRPSAGSWAAQAAQRRRREEASGAGSPHAASPAATEKASDAAPPARKESAEAATATPAPAIKPSAGSWAAQQRKKRDESTSGVVSDADFKRSVKSILNKLTLEKFDALYEKLIACGIRTPAQVEILVGEIVEKARAQHHFVKMYADLCTRLEGEFVALAECNFKWILLSQCQKSFEDSLKPLPEALIQGEDADEVKAKHKERMLGNIKLTGELLMRQMLSSKVLIACAEDLLESPPVADRLECLAVLLQVTGSAFDNTAWTQHAALNAIFDTVSDLSKAPSVPSRVRCILRDVLDLRAAGWVDSRAVARVEGPKRLEEVKEEAEAECIFIDKPKREWEPRAEGVTPVGAPPPLAPGARSDILCSHWVKHACKFGSQCAFSHAGPGGNAKDAPTQAAPAGRSRQDNSRTKQSASQENWRNQPTTSQDNWCAKQANPVDNSAPQENWRSKQTASQQKAGQSNQAWQQHHQQQHQQHQQQGGGGWRRLRTCLLEAC